MRNPIEILAEAGTRLQNIKTETDKIASLGAELLTLASPTKNKLDIDETPTGTTVVLKPGDSIPSDISGKTLVIEGDFGPIKIGHKYGPKMSGGTAKIIAGSKGGKIQGLKFYGSDIRGQLLLAEGLEVQPEANPDGSSMGDFSSIRAMGALPYFHLAMRDVTISSPSEWDSFDGFGYKWGVWLQGCKLSMSDVQVSATREHSVYGHNMLGVHCLRVSNTFRIKDQGKYLGNGRTHLQFVNRASEGSPSSGDIILEDCNAMFTGWEGLRSVIVPGGGIDLEKAYGRGGGAAYTVAGHTGDSVQILGCTVTNPYANGVAVYVDYGKNEKVTSVNPYGYRCWMQDQNGKTYDPTGQMGISIPSYATRKLIIENYNQNRRGSRTPVLISGVDVLQTDSSVTDFDIGYQKGLD